MKEFIKFLSKNNYSKNTIITYRNVIKKYMNDFSDIRNIKNRIKRYFDSPNTAWTHYNIILSYMRFIKDKRIEKLKELKIPPIPIKYMPIASKQFIMNKTKDLDNYKNIIVRFLFETGIRASEINNILSIDKKTLLVKGKGSKIREIFHNNETTKLFKGFNYSTKTLRIWVKEVMGKRFSPHSLRRSHATHMLLRGANPKIVMLQLGHTKVETTFRYLQISKQKNMKIYNKYF